MLSGESRNDQSKAAMMTASNSPRTPRLIRVALLLGASALAGCASGKHPVDTRAAGVAREVSAVTNETGPGVNDPIADAAFWGTRYERDPQNADIAVNFSTALRRIGSNKEAVKVATETVRLNPESAVARLELGKALIADDRAHEAERHLAFAVAALPDDWSARSAYGVALDLMGDHRKARVEYERALKIAPDAASVLNNMAMSFALTGRLIDAERIARDAATAPGATARVRQNLALILAFKGDISEAERLARSDLPPQTADNNISYYRQLVAQPAYWGGLDNVDLDTPNFDDEPAEADDDVAGGPISFNPGPVSAPTSLASSPAPTLAPSPVKTAEPAARPVSAGAAAPTPASFAPPRDGEIETNEPEADDDGLGDLIDVEPVALEPVEEETTDE